MKTFLEQENPKKPEKDEIKVSFLQTFSTSH